MDGWQTKVMERLPLADAVLQAWRFVIDEAFLAQMFERYRGRSYTQALSFESIVHLTGEALLEHAGSGHRAIQSAERRAQLEASAEAFYGKLRRLPPALSHGFLCDCTGRMRELLPPSESPLPKSLDHFEVLAIDGKKIKHAAKRLVAARKFSGSVLGGKTLVALCLKTQLAVAMTSHCDGETNDPPLVPDLLSQLRDRLSGPRLYVLDRQFCDLKLPVLLTAQDDHFVIRYHKKVTFTRDTEQPVRRGEDRHGRKFQEEWGWLGAANHKLRRYVRRITLHRAGEENVIVVTDLLDAKKYPAADLLELYRRRWNIERVFQQITEVFHLRHLIASTPEGTIFQCAFCLLLYNLLNVQRSYAAAQQAINAEAISLENIFYDAHRQLTAWNELLGPAWTVRHLQSPPTAASLCRRLKHLLATAWHDDWKKAVKKKPPPHTAKKKIPGGHTSIYRLTRKHLRP